MPEIKTNLIEVEFRPDADVASELENIINPGDFLKYAVKEQLAVAVEEIKERNKPKFGEWVDVEVQSPEICKNVLVADGQRNINIGYIGTDHVWKNSTSSRPLMRPPTHWMPLPQ